MIRFSLLIFVFACLWASPASAITFFGNETPECQFAPGSLQLSQAGSVTRTCGVQDQGALVKIIDAAGASDCADIPGAAGVGPESLLVQWDDSLGAGGEWKCVTSAPGAGSVLVREEDGTPSDSSVSTIRVPNGSLTVNGSGDVSIDIQGVSPTIVAGLPGSAGAEIFLILDGANAHDCAVGVGSELVLCYWDGSAFRAFGIQTLADLPQSGATDGQFVVWNNAAQEYQPQSPGFAIALGDLSDVTSPTPSAGEVLTWTGAAWEDAAVDLANAASVTGVLPEANIDPLISRDSELGTHAGLPNVHHLPTVDTNTNATTECVGPDELFDSEGDCVLASSGGGVPVSDTTPLVQSAGDPTKQVRIDASNLTSGATHAILMADAPVDLAALDETNLAATVSPGDGFLLDFGGMTKDTTGEGLRVPSTPNTCTGGNTVFEGDLCWQRAQNLLFAGNAEGSPTLINRNATTVCSDPAEVMNRAGGCVIPETGSFTPDSYPGEDHSEYVPAAADRVLDILNPPPGSGLVAPVGDAIEDDFVTPQTDDAPAINAAIQYACDNDYNVAYLGAGSYRVGHPIASAFYSGVKIQAEACPQGIKFYGAGVGNTILLANAVQGQYLVTLADFSAGNTSVTRSGWNVQGDQIDGLVTAFTNADPARITASDGSRLSDGDRIHIRNCDGITEANEREFIVDSCTGVDGTSCALKDKYGVDIDSTSWGTWIDSTTRCIVSKVFDEFDTEVAYMTLRDDDHLEHGLISCTPNCVFLSEESHGMGLIVSGGQQEIHHISIEGMGDEGIDISAHEAGPYIHDMQVINAVHGALPIYSGKGIVIERVRIVKTAAYQNPSGQFGTPTEPPYTNGDCWSVAPTGKNWRVINTTVKDVTCIGEIGQGWDVVTGPTADDEPGQYVDGVNVIGGFYGMRPQAKHCDDLVWLPCYAFRIRADVDYYPLSNVTVTGGIYSGGVILAVAQGGTIRIESNTFRPIPTALSGWGLTGYAKHLLLRDNDFADFDRGAFLHDGYETVEGVNETITTRIEGNRFANFQGTGGDAMITRINPQLPPGAGDEGYWDILDNQFLVSAGSDLNYVIWFKDDWLNVNIADNVVRVNPATNLNAVFYTTLVDATYRNNSITHAGRAHRVVLADDVTISGDRMDGLGNILNTAAVTVENSNGFRISGATMENFGHVNASGVFIVASAAGPYSGFTIDGNTFKNITLDIDIDAQGNTLRDFRITDNDFDLSDLANARGAKVEDATQGFFQGNNITNSGGTGAAAYESLGLTNLFHVNGNYSDNGALFIFGSNAALGDETCSATGAGGLSECRNNYGGNLATVVDSIEGDTGGPTTGANISLLGGTNIDVACVGDVCTISSTAGGGGLLADLAGDTGPATSVANATITAGANVSTSSDANGVTISATNTDAASKCEGANVFLNGDDGCVTPSGLGDVLGPASALNNELLASDGTTGKLLKASGVSAVGGVLEAAELVATPNDGFNREAHSPNSTPPAVPVALNECNTFFLEDGKYYLQCEGDPSPREFIDAATVHGVCLPAFAHDFVIGSADDVESVWRAPHALTLTEVWCEMTIGGTADMDLEIDDGTPALVMGAPLTCSGTPASDSVGLSGAMAAGDRLDVDIDSVSGGPAGLRICVRYTR